MKRKQTSKTARKASRNKPSTLIEGVFLLHPRGFGYVEPDSYVERGDILRVSTRNTGEAMPGDRVIAALKRKGKRNGRIVYSCEIREVIEHTSKALVGTLQKTKDGVFLLPDGKRRQSPVLVRFNDQDELPLSGSKIAVEIVEYPKAGLCAVGVISEVLGMSGEPEAEMLAIMRQKGLIEEFPAAISTQAEMAADEFLSITDHGHQFPKREVVKETTIITIDPEDARDFDDAVSIVSRAKGRVTLGVHIADVSYFVLEDTPLDREARKRSTSIYFPSKVIPMLPHVLSSGVCSLMEGEPRLVKSVYITYDADGNVIATDFKESTITSSKRLTYEQAQAILDGERIGLTSDVAMAIKELGDLAKIIERRRMARGMLHLDLREVGLKLNEQGKMIDAAPKKQLDANTMIEMFMVEANEAVAGLLNRLGVTFILRAHKDPDVERLKSLKDAVQVFGYTIPDTPSRRELQALVNSVHGLPEEYAVNMAVLRSLSQAKYTTESIGHYALASDSYCHFTSPIRRYPDLTIQRLFAKHCQGKIIQDDIHDSKMEGLADHCTKKELEAKGAENEMLQVLILLYLKDREKEVFDGIITGFSEYGVFVQFLKLLTDGMIRFSDLGDEWFDIFDNKGTIKGQKTQKIFRIGQMLKVRIKSIDLPLRRLNLLLA